LEYYSDNFSERRNPNISIMPGELIYFFSGDCNDATVQDGIKNHFITVMEDLANNRNWSNICPSFCNVNDVTVTCGPTTGRRRREGSSQTHFVKRSTNEITLSFSLTMRWLLEGDFWYNDDRIVPLSTEIKTMNTNGEFDYNGISPVIAFTHSSMGCEEGSVPDYYTDTCSKLKCFIYAQCCVTVKIYSVIIFLNGKIEIACRLFPQLDSNIPTVPMYGVYIPTTHSYTRACSMYSYFVTTSPSPKYQTIQSRNFKESSRVIKMFSEDINAFLKNDERWYW
jgi:hypothetical protein